MRFGYSWPRAKGAALIAGSIWLACGIGDSVALTDEEIRQQIDRAVERGRQPDRPASAKPVAPAPPAVRETTFEPVAQVRDEFTAFRFTGELGNAQTYQVAVIDSVVWVGTSIGLVRFDSRTNQWSLIRSPKASGGEMVSAVVAAGNRLAVQVLHHTGPRNIVHPKGAWWYEPATNRWERIGTNDFLDPLYWDGRTLWSRIGDSLYQLDPSTGKSSEYSQQMYPILRNVGVQHMLVSGYEAWICTTGNYNRQTRQFEDGGILMLHLQTKLWRQFLAREDGPAHNYCAAIAADNESIWVAHWEPDRGLSRYDRKRYRWEHVPLARNRMVVGGTKLALDPQRVWIGHQSGLSWLDRKSRIAGSASENTGLPGYITSGMAQSPDSVWAAMYAYGGDTYYGVRSSGLVRFHKSAAKGR